MLLTIITAIAPAFCAAKAFAPNSQLALYTTAIFPVKLAVRGGAQAIVSPPGASTNCKVPVTAFAGTFKSGVAQSFPPGSAYVSA